MVTEYDKLEGLFKSSFFFLCAAFDLLNEMDGILQQRIQDVELHKNLMLQIADLKQKVRRERLQVKQLTIFRFLK